MKKVLSIIISTVLIALLAGCSNSNNNSSEYAAPTGAIEQNKTERITETPTIPSLSSVKNAVRELAENDDMIMGENVDEVIEDKYNEGSYDSYEIYQYLCDNGYCNEPAKEGILIVSLSTGEYYTYNSTNTFKFTAFTVNLDKINPDTGEINHVRSFSSEDTHSCSSVIYCIGGDTSCTRQSFNEDFTKMTATVTMQDGAVHVGWIDGDGSFTDVSEQITTKSDFSGLTRHEYPRFFGDYLYFRDLTNENVQIKRVPVNSLGPEKVETLLDGTTWNGTTVYPLPDGSVLDSPTALHVYYDESMKYPANSNFFTDWISENVCVGSEKGMIYKYYLHDNSSSSLSWYSDKQALVPDIKGRTNWSAVVSPDGKKVAFLSRLTSGTDTTASLYIVSSDGGEPTKIETQYAFPSDYSVYVKYTVGLLDWD